MHLFIATLVSIAMVTADVYFHNPRGSNNREDESQRERRNANRMFDSQNNERGGYNTGPPMVYYAGSKLQIEWTNQHSCGGDNAKCNIIIQMMCGPYLKDGENTETIPENDNQCNKQNCTEDFRYGMHETIEYYHKCKNTQRNKGLFTADQDLDGNSAIYTRQNPDGDRFAYECPEERDYYPYWRSSPWIDVALLVHDEGDCESLKSESQNVKERYECEKEDYSDLLPITESECSAIGGSWVNKPSHGVPEPFCGPAPKSRDNHNGNGVDGEANKYIWTIPDYTTIIPNFETGRCALRIRYNISTGDYPTDRDANHNGDNSPVNVSGLSEDQWEDRGFVFKGDPEVRPFDLDFDLALAINTQQYGRTFQDRSHRFTILSNVDSPCTGNIHNLNVRGKRGNIVQVYPAVEYDFVPNTIEANVGDCVHFQWTGSDNNNQNNDGEGKAKTDRSNAVLLKDNVLANSYPEHLGSELTFLGLSRQHRSLLANLNQTFNKNNPKVNDISLLNDASAYFNLQPVRVRQEGTYHYMCTRNNNFSNRSQKGKIVVSQSDAKDEKSNNEETSAKIKRKDTKPKRTYHEKLEEMIQTISQLER